MNPLTKTAKFLDRKFAATPRVQKFSDGTEYRLGSSGGLERITPRAYVLRIRQDYPQYSPDFPKGFKRASRR